MSGRCWGGHESYTDHWHTPAAHHIALALRCLLNLGESRRAAALSSKTSTVSEHEGPRGRLQQRACRSHPPLWPSGAYAAACASPLLVSPHFCPCSAHASPSGVRASHADGRAVPASVDCAPVTSWLPSCTARTTPVAHDERSAEAPREGHQAPRLQRCRRDRAVLRALLRVSRVCTVCARTMWHSFCCSLF